MKRINYLIIAVIGAALGLACFLPVNSESSKHVVLQEESAMRVQAPIGCLIVDTELEEILENLKTERKYDIFFTEAIDEAFIKKTCSAIIIDRNVVGTDIGKAYLDFYHELKGDTPLLIVDEISDWVMPVRGNEVQGQTADRKQV